MALSRSHFESGLLALLPRHSLDQEPSSAWWRTSQFRPSWTHPSVSTEPPNWPIHFALSFLVLKT